MGRISQFEKPCETEGPLLRVHGLCAGYGDKEILHNVTLDVLPRETVTLVGPNGSGKSTLLKAISGLVECRSGSVRFDGEMINHLSIAGRIARGLIYMPQGNCVFRNLTVRDNLIVSLRKSSLQRQKQEIDRIAEILPTVRGQLHRIAGSLSGGEKQAVSLAIALMKRPRLLLCDEPSLGLAPGLLNRVFAGIADASRDLSMAVLLVEHKVREAFIVSHRIVGLRRGSVVKVGQPVDFDEVTLKGIFLA